MGTHTQDVFDKAMELHPCVASRTYTQASLDMAVAASLNRAWSSQQRRIERMAANEQPRAAARMFAVGGAEDPRPSPATEARR